jgi:hypothetical protein
MPLECDNRKSSFQSQYWSYQAQAGQTLTTLLNTIATIRHGATSCATPTSPFYSAACCTAYNNRLSGAPWQFTSERLEMIKQECLDAINDIDCAENDWPDRCNDAQDKLQDLINFDADATAMNNTLSGWLSQNTSGCPVSSQVDDPEAGGGD